MLSSLLDLVNRYLLGPGLCIAVFVCGIFLTVRLRAFFLTKPKRVAAALLSSGNGGGTSPIRAMMVALAGTLGVGNIAGVASAIYIGGAGAIFWMWVSLIAALPIKYAEIVLAIRHRRTDSTGIPHGGAYYYIADRGGRGAKTAAAVFAVLCLAASLAMGCAVQSNAIAVSARDALGIHPAISGILVGGTALLVISGGFTRISDLCMKLIPAMSGIYIAMALYVILTNLPLAGEVFCDIVANAFSPDAVGGGIIGHLTCNSLRIGVTRGIVSNEAGCGTAPIAHAGACVRSPAAQGIWGMVEVFVDTAIICSLTAFAVLIAGKHGIGVSPDGMASAIASFGHFIPFAGQLLFAAVLIFAFCTIICWFFYGTESLSYLTTSRTVRIVYTIIYALTAAAGAVLSDGIVWSLSDFAIAAMTALNVTAVMQGIGEIRHETDNYFYKNGFKFVNKSMSKLNKTVDNRRIL